VETPTQPDKFADIASALKSRGWQASAGDSGVCFSLDEPVVGGVTRLTLIFDPEGLWRPPLATHHSVSGDPKNFSLHRLGSMLCYIDPDSIELDPESADYIGNIVHLADRAVGELHRLQKGIRVGPEDSEFPVHWDAATAYLDIPDAQWPPDSDARLEMTYIQRPANLDADDLLVFCIPDNRSKSRHGGQRVSLRKVTVPQVFIRISYYPFKTWQDSPPATLAEFTAWLTAHHPVDSKHFWRHLADAVLDTHGRQSNALVLVDTAAGRLGVLVEPPENVLKGHRRGAPLANALRGNNGLSKCIRISRFEFERLDDDFVLTRNSPTKTAVLAGKRIDLIGAGTIGGHLADLLVQAGAGKSGGALRIFDPQRLRTENLGRHILGVSALGLNKSSGIVRLLERERFAENVSAHPLSAGDPSIHEGADLIIDATGSPSLGAQLSNFARRARVWALLSVSVEGDGWYATGHLYRGEPGEACRTCLQPWIGGEGSFIPGDTAVTQLSNACGGFYTPYRASASTIAAALASEMTCDWAAESPHPLHRVVAMPNAPRSGTPVKYSSPTSKEGCVCGLKSPTL